MRSLKGILVSVLTVGLSAQAFAQAPYPLTTELVWHQKHGVKQVQMRNGHPSQLRCDDAQKVKIAVTRFHDKTSNLNGYRSEFGTGIRDMLITALDHTGCFQVLEREHLEARDFEAQGKIERADFLVTAAVTEFEIDAGHANVSPGSWGGLGRMIPPILQGSHGVYQRAHVAMDLRLSDTHTTRIVATATAEGSASGFNVGWQNNMIGHKTPMGQAVRQMIQQAVNIIVPKTTAVRSAQAS